ncbi:MPN527 family putative ECF transporter permease subunit [Mycoplasmopsis alligatoris]|uniref:Uncharacterized protein n=1 Tax=Mycoplasmopsis alligatoris A21JP2 TaxID=747682 RepID=D4XWZ6_9BACT|nr:hypothetical protein [Mycoplasmopsis alligatoris]EFF41138.1 conserved hypothetical protein [Mycoplasmopsis alligatoris A21JP2]
MRFSKTNSSRNITIKITLTGMLLGLTLLFNYLSAFMPFAGTFLKFDFSLIFVFVTFYFVGFRYGIILLVIRFLLGPLMGGAPTADKWLGHAILLLTHATFVLFFYLMYKILIIHSKCNLVNEYYLNSPISQKKYKFYYLKLIAIFAISILITSVLITSASTFIFNPLYFWIYKNLFGFGHIQEPTYRSLLESYEEYRLFFFGIKPYALGSYALFIPFNLLNLSINSAILIIILMLDYKTNVFSKYKENSQNIY